MSAGDWALALAREIVTTAAERSYKAGLGVSEWEAFLHEETAQALREAKRAGRESMREEAAKVADAEAKSEAAWALKYQSEGEDESFMHNALGGHSSSQDIAADIRNLPLDEPSRSTDAGGGGENE